MDASNKWRVCLPVSLCLLTLLIPSASAAPIECKTNVRCEGTDDDDTMFGTDGHNHMRGNGGVDKLLGNGGPDRLHAGPLNDTLNPYDHGIDVLIGGPGPDGLHGGRFDALVGGTGRDRLYGARGTAWIEGGPGDDLLDGGGFANAYIFRRGHGDDTIVDDRTRTGQPCTPAATSRVDDPDGNLLHFRGTPPLVIRLDSSWKRDEVRAVNGSGSINWAENAIAQVRSGPAADIISGNDGPNCFVIKGADVVYGKRGIDDVFARRGGPAKIFAGRGNDIIHVVDYAKNARPDLVDCGAGEKDEVRHDPNDELKHCEIRDEQT